MNIKKVTLVSAFLFFLVFKPSFSYASGFGEIFVSGDSIIVRIVEGVEYLFTFTAEKKIEVLEKHAERKLETARQYAEEGQQEKVQSMLLRYERIKERIGKIIKKNDDRDVLGSAQERVVNQQVTIEEIKSMVDINVKNEIMEIQENVVNNAVEWVVEVDGPEGQTEFFEKVEHVWAPGTGPGEGAGVVIEGGEMRFAPGTEPPGMEQGTPSDIDIQNVVIESEGGNGDDGESVVIEVD